MESNKGRAAVAADVPLVWAFWSGAFLVVVDVEGGAVVELAFNGPGISAYYTLETSRIFTVPNTPNGDRARQRSCYRENTHTRDSC